jgi:hypothetical protein
MWTNVFFCILRDSKLFNHSNKTSECASLVEREGNCLNKVSSNEFLKHFPMVFENIAKGISWLMHTSLETARIAKKLTNKKQTNFIVESNDWLNPNNQ